MKKFIATLPVISLGFSLALLASSATASTYASASGETRMTFYEKPGTPEYQSLKNPRGEYVTRIQGKTWIGNINITKTVTGVEGHKYYTGTFRDFHFESGREITCEGSVSIFRTRLSRTDPLGMRVTWQVAGGKSCPSVGKTYQLSMTEKLPRPDASGNFTPNNSEGTINGGIWQEWKVVSQDGSLNCRLTPNGQIKKAYKTGQTIKVVSDRAGRAFTGSNNTAGPELSSPLPYPIQGDPWVRTADICFVRANTRYIQPVSLPF